jgi:PKD repeat protein
MNNDCGACHGNGGRDDPPLDNCMQCHGRDADAGGDNISAGLGRGLRQHHETLNAAACGSCHGDATGAAGVGEDVLPSFYSAALGGAGLDSCDGSEERFASLTVSLDNDGDGLTDSDDPDCQSNQAPTADPGGPYNASAGSSISFDGSASSDPDGSIVSYDWDFGDNGTATGATPSHTYSSAGTFVVALTVTDDGNATDTQTVTATITAQPLPPTADAGGPYSGTVGSPVNFDGSGSSDSDGTLVAFAWDFGDGGSASGSTATHTYSVDGTFTVTLSVTDSDGMTSTDTTSAAISPAGVNSPPVARANGPYNGTEGASIQFSSSGSSDPDGTIASYAWDFGDGNTSSAANPTHTYVAAGTYTVSLRVTDNAGDSAMDTTAATIEAVVVNKSPVADAGGPYSGLVGDTISFNGGASVDTDGSIVRYDWDFGDGATLPDAGPSASHIYSAAGTYTVTLSVTDDGGASSSAASTATITDPSPNSDGETQYGSYCASCHGDPWGAPAVDPTLAGVHRVAGARSCSIDGSIFGTFVFPDGAPGMQSLQEAANNGSIDTAAIAEYLNSEPVTDEQYYVAACAGCHGDDGSGGRTGENVIGDDAGDIREAINDESAMHYLACLPDSDLEAMARFLAGSSGTDDTGADDSDHEDDSESDSGGGGSGDLPLLALLATLALFRSRPRRLEIDRRNAITPG